VNPKQLNVKLIIPNINCTRCSIQIVNPMTDKIPGGSCCPYPTGDNFCKSVYHSCANVIIAGTIPVESYRHQYNGPCGSYTQQSGNWTFDENKKVWEINDGYEVRNQCAGFRPRCN